ncbi:stage V sporulation protein AC [Gorillibacterium timonense]|uniref:stage V sporulation protein AC n=1 Tax=Gorillibacterium timonense TaxID=1689269 RepID=UPI00071C8C06|nr:stage V sporulation protein AC [Gorillibacterium timonense]
MANKKKTTPVQKKYQELAKTKEPPRTLVRNSIIAFVVGGLICVLGEFLRKLFQDWGFTEKTAGDPTVAVLILISCILTGCGVYDKIAQWAGAGTAVPVTGFANSICSAAMEHRSEGLVYGIGGNMFKVAGAVIVFGTVAAFFVGIIHGLFSLGG